MSVMTDGTEQNVSKATYSAVRYQWADCKWTYVDPDLLNPSVHQSHSSRSSNLSSTEGETIAERERRMGRKDG